MKLMVGYDGSRVANDAMKVARAHAKAFQAEVAVVTSLQKEIGDDVDKIREAEKGLAYAKEYFEAASIPCETHLLVRGLSSGEDLVIFAQENSIDEIIVGVRRRSKVGKLLLGSAAQYVILNASCPVLTVK